MYLKNYHIHFIGIGGVGMSGIAKLLLQLNYIVSGSDITSTKTTKLLRKLGGNIFLGHKQEHIKGANVVVVSSAINSTNVEIKAAITAKIPVISRAKMLSELMKQKYSIAISGTHGKTSTTALIGNLLKVGKLDPTILLGGILKEIGSNALLGRGDFIIAEVDESDGSLIEYSPTIAVITNIDRDHLNFYKDMNAIKQFFSKFINRIPFYGMAILCLDNKATQEIMPQINKKIVTYGIKSDADLKASKINLNGMRSQFDISYLGKNQGEIILNLPGIHNIYNALASITVGLQLNIPLDIIKIVLSGTKGVKRRMELKGEINGITVIDDYAHHPTEILAVLKTVNRGWPSKRKIIVFQPHRYTRIKSLFHEFVNSFYELDVLIILPIYSAGEQATKTVKSENLCVAIQKNSHKQVFYSENFKNCIKKLTIILKKGDLLITMGAGNVNQIGEIILKSLTRYVENNN